MSKKPAVVDLVSRRLPRREPPELALQEVVEPSAPASGICDLERREPGVDGGPVGEREEAEPEGLGLLDLVGFEAGVGVGEVLEVEVHVLALVGGEGRRQQLAVDRRREREAVVVVGRVEPAVGVGERDLAAVEGLAVGRAEEREEHLPLEPRLERVPVDVEVAGERRVRPEREHVLPRAVARPHAGVVGDPVQDDAQPVVAARRHEPVEATPPPERLAHAVVVDDVVPVRGARARRGDGREVEVAHAQPREVRDDGLGVGEPELGAELKPVRRGHRQGRGGEHRRGERGRAYSRRARSVPRGGAVRGRRRGRPAPTSVAGARRPAPPTLAPRAPPAARTTTAPALGPGRGGVGRVLGALGGQDDLRPARERERLPAHQVDERRVAAAPDDEGAVANRLDLGRRRVAQGGAEGEERARKGERVRVAGRLALGPVEDGRAERGLGLRVGHLAGEAGEVLELALAAGRDERAELVVVVGEERERGRRRPLLAHEQERRFGRHQEERRRGPERGRRDLVVQARPRRPVADLVVVLDADDALLAAHALRARPPCLARPLGGAAVVEPATAERLGDLGRRRVGEVGVVALGVAREHVADLVVEVVGPDGVEAVAAPPPRRDEAGVVPVVLRDQQAGRGEAVDVGRELLKKVRVRVVDERVRGVEAEPVEAVLLQPMPRVVQEQVADAARAVVVEVHGLPPRRLVLRGEHGTECGDVGAVRAEVVVDDVEEHGEALGVGRVHEPAQVAGAAVGVGRRVEGGAVVAPPALAGEVGERQELDGRYAEVCQVPQPLADAVERALLRERPDVELVHDEVFQHGRRPPVAGPRERGRVHHLARAVDALRLVPRGGVRDMLASVERDPVAVARRHPAHERLVVAVARGVERGGPSVEDDLDAVGGGRPDAEADAAGFDEGAEAGGSVHEGTGEEGAVECAASPFGSAPPFPRACESAWTPGGVAFDRPAHTTWGGVVPTGPRSLEHPPPSGHLPQGRGKGRRPAPATSGGVVVPLVTRRSPPRPAGLRSAPSSR